MADTPKGDTASPIDPSDEVGTGDALRSAGGAADAETVKPDTIAGGAAADILTAGSADERAIPPAPQGDRAQRRSGGARWPLYLALVILVAAGGAYASYPLWRDRAEPLAQRVGITLPEIAPWQRFMAPAAQPAPAASKPAPESPPVASAPAAEPPAPPARAADPKLAGEVDRLIDRVNALEQRLAAVESQPAAAPSSAAQPAADLEARVGTMAQRLAAVSDEVAIVRETLGSSGGEGLGPIANRLSDRLQGLSGRVDALEQAPAAPTVSPERLDALQSRLDTVSGKLDTEVHTSAEDVVQMETRLASLQGRLDQMAKALENTRSGREKAGAFLLAANQLAATAGTSTGFEAELGALRATAPADPEVSAALETLGRHAGGAPSLAVLRGRFPKIASAAVNASVVGSGEGVIGQALTRMASLVTIRRIDSADGDGLDAHLVQAESALAAGDLTAAVAAVQKLDGGPAKVAAPWLVDAEARVVVDAAVRTLQARALAGVVGS